MVLRFSAGLADYGAGFVSGNAETRLVDLAAAYAGLARGGSAMRAKFLSAEHQPVRRIASEEATAIITDILCDNEARQRSFGSHSPLAFEQRVAAKTGTSSGFRDTWTVGLDKEHTVAVWAGNFDSRPMRDTFAVLAATPLWAAVMQELLRRDHPLDPPVENERLVRREICKTTGLLPSCFSPAKLSELFWPERSHAKTHQIVSRAMGNWEIRPVVRIKFARNVGKRADDKARPLPSSRDVPRGGYAQDR